MIYCITGGNRGGYNQGRGGGYQGYQGRDRKPVEGRRDYKDDKRVATRGGHVSLRTLLPVIMI